MLDVFLGASGIRRIGFAIWIAGQFPSNDFTGNHGFVLMILLTTYSFENKYTSCSFK